MIERLIIGLKRLLVLIPGLVGAYLAADKVYPYFDRRIPATLAVFVTYVITAYGLIPLIIRAVRVVIKPRHLPLYCTTPDGFVSDPVNIALVGTQEQVVSAMTEAGWHLADQRNVRSILRLGFGMLFRRPYPTAPFSNLFLFGRRQDLGFQIPLDDNPRHRHHVRFWGVVDVSDVRYREHTVFWRRHHTPPVPGQLLWLGSASQDIGIGVIRHNAQLTHMIHANTDAERKLIVQSLKRANRVKRVRTIRVEQPYRLQNRVLRGYLKTDGRIKVCELKG